MSQLPAPYKVEMTVKKQVTIAAGATTSTSLKIPQGTEAGLKGYGHTWYISNTFQLVADQIQFPSRTDQEGCASIPRIFEQSIPIKPGASVSLIITNGDSSDHTYDIVFYFYLSQMFPNSPDYQSTGGELVISTGSSSGVANNAVIYNSSLTTAANVTAAGLEVSPQSPSTLLAGTQTTVTAAALALASSTACRKVTLKAPASNGSEIVYIGNATNQTYPLYALDSKDLEIDDLATIFIKRGGSTNVSIEFIGS